MKDNETFGVEKGLIHEKDGMRLLEETEVEKHFSEALEVDPGNPKVISGRARARFKQNNLCGALEDLVSLERITVEDLFLGARCYFGLGMLNRAVDILKFLESNGCVKSNPEFLELSENISRE